MFSNSTNPKIDRYELRDQFAKKLAHYATRDPKRFLQMDGFQVKGDGDDIMRPDKDGDCLFSIGTTELMAGATVRVLIPEETDPKVAIRHLKKFTKWLKKSPDLMDFAKPVKKDEIDPEDMF